MAAATVLATLETSASGVEFFNVISQPLTFDHVGTCFYFFVKVLIILTVLKSLGVL